MPALTLEPSQRLEPTPSQHTGVATKAIITAFSIILVLVLMSLGTSFAFGWRASVANALPAAAADPVPDGPVRHSEKTLEVSLQ